MSVTERSTHTLPSQRGRLLRALLETGGFRSAPTPVFPLASGILSPYYIDCKIALSFPLVRQLVGEMMYDRIRSLHVDAVGGLLIGAYPIAIAVSDAAFRISGRLVRAFVIRKEAKGHGLKKLIEGQVDEGDAVIIVDDVITSGSSTIEAIKKSRDAGLHVVKALALIDREEQCGRENIQAQGVDFDALCTLGQLKDAQERGTGDDR